MRIELANAYYSSPEYLAKLRVKLEVMAEMEKDPYLRSSKILDVYSVDPVAFIEHFCLIQFKEINEVKPFFLFEYQKEIIHRFQELEQSKTSNNDMLIDKPRAMGLTWLACAYFLWRWLFTPNYSTLLMSRKEELVDDGMRVPDGSLFGKIRFMIDHLPPYLVPEGYQPKAANRGTGTDMKLRLLNPKLGSSIIGSSTNATAGRSSRYNLVFIDECFFIERFQEVIRSLESVSRAKIFVSTVIESRTAEMFKNMCEEKGNYVSLRWNQHPFKDEQWFKELDEKANLMDDPDLMREAQPSYSVSPKSQYYPNISESRIEPLDYNRNLPLWVSLDVGGRKDLTVILWWQYVAGWFHLLEGYSNTNRDADWYAPFMNPELSWNETLYNDFQGKMLNNLRAWKKPVAYFGEMDHFTKKMPTNTSVADVLAKYGIRLRYNRYAINHPPRRMATQQILPKIIFNKSSEYVLECFDALARSKYANAAKTTTEQLKPIHGDDGTADYRAAVENFAVNTPALFRFQREDIPQEQKSFAGAIIKAMRY
jgi:hypothetical protein